MDERWRENQTIVSVRIRLQYKVSAKHTIRHCRVREVLEVNNSVLGLGGDQQTRGCN